MDRTRAEHLGWVKERALEFARTGAIDRALASLASDMTKHPETKTQSMRDVIVLAHELRMSGHMGTAAETVKFIEGIN